MRGGILEKSRTRGLYLRDSDSGIDGFLAAIWWSSYPTMPFFVNGEQEIGWL